MFFFVSKRFVREPATFEWLLFRAVLVRNRTGDSDTPTPLEIATSSFSSKIQIRCFKSRIFQDFRNDFRAFGTLKLIKTVSKWSLKSAFTNLVGWSSEILKIFKTGNATFWYDHISVVGRSLTTNRISRNPSGSWTFYYRYCFGSHAATNYPNQ